MDRPPMLPDPPQIKMGRFFPLWRRMAYRLFANHAFLRTVATDDGKFDAYVTAGAQLSVLRPFGVEIDPVHRRFIARWVKPDSVIWDVGANMGLFAFPAALRASRGQVYAFEPDVELAANLIRSLRRSRNKRLPVTVAPFALSDREGAARFQISAYGRSMNKLEGLGSWHDHLFVASETRVVATLRFDLVAEVCRPPDIVKIDVEGAEMMVLTGGRATIKEHRPVMLIEGPNELADAMRSFLVDLDYVIVDGASETFAVVDRPVWDTLAVPREKWIAQENA